MRYFQQLLIGLIFWGVLGCEEYCEDCNIEYHPAEFNFTSPTSIPVAFVNAKGDTLRRMVWQPTIQENRYFYYEGGRQPIALQWAAHPDSVATSVIFTNPQTGARRKMTRTPLVPARNNIFDLTSEAYLKGESQNKQFIPETRRQFYTYILKTHYLDSAIIVP